MDRDKLTECDPWFRRCGGRMVPWWGTDGHNGRERFYTCDRCGRTS